MTTEQTRTCGEYKGDGTADRCLSTEDVQRVVWRYGSGSLSSAPRCSSCRQRVTAHADLTVYAVGDNAAAVFSAAFAQMQRVAATPLKAS